MTTATAPAPPAVTVTDSGRWRGVLGLMDAWSADARMLEAPTDGEPVRARPLPLPLLVQPELAPGHDGGKLGIGVIDRIWTEQGFVMGEGRFDMEDPTGAELARKVGLGFIRFVSLDVDDATAHQVCLGPDGQLLPNCDPTDPTADMGMIYSGWRVMGATLLAHPAFPDAHIALADDTAHTTAQSAQAAVRLADAPAPVPDATTPEIAGYDPAWGCVLPNTDGTAWDTADCATPGAVQANATGDGPFNPEEVACADTPPVPEEQVQDEGTGCVAPDPATQGAWLPADCTAPGAVPANADGTAPAEEVTQAASEANTDTAAATSGAVTLAVDTSLPWAERDRAWDGDQARQNVAGWATTGEGDAATLDPAKMGKAFLVVDGDPTNEGSYKFGVADMVDGDLKLVWNGVTASNAALNGARTPPAITADQKTTALAAIKTLYGKAATAFNDPTITDDQGAQAATYALPFPDAPGDTPSQDTSAQDPTNPDNKDQGNGCVCPQDDDTWAPCECTEDNAVTADTDGQPLQDDTTDPMEMAAMPADCQPCQAIAITASASTDTLAATGFVPPASCFQPPNPTTGPHPVTVDTTTGILSGYLAAWGTCHVGFRDRCITPPRSKSGYAYYNIRPVTTDEGTVYCGLITMDTGHAPLDFTAASTIAHYDNTGTQAAVVRVGEDQHGIWLAGITLPTLTPAQRLRLSLASFSGDWRGMRGGAELMAALAVNTPGFPLAATKTGTGNTPYALVAAGALPNPQPPTTKPIGHITANLTLDATEVARIVLGELDARDNRKARFARVTTAFTELGRSARQARTAMAKAKVADLADDIPKGIRATKSDLELASRKDFANWVDQQGGLPRKIKSVAQKLQAKGMGESQSIAVAVNVARKACASGDTNWPGVQQINAKSKAEYCAAIARWEQMKAAANAG